jgi:hypothetical protein
MNDLDEAWEVGTGEVFDGLSCGDTALLVGEIRYRGRGSGIEDAAPVGWSLDFRAGKLVRFGAFRDPDDVFRGLGLNT